MNWEIILTSDNDYWGCSKDRDELLMIELRAKLIRKDLLEYTRNIGVFGIWTYNVRWIFTLYSVWCFFFDKNSVWCWECWECQGWEMRILRFGVLLFWICGSFSVEMWKPMLWGTYDTSKRKWCFTDVCKSSIYIRY